QVEVVVRDVGDRAAGHDAVDPALRHAATIAEAEEVNFEVGRLGTRVLDDVGRLEAGSAAEGLRDVGQIQRGCCRTAGRRVAAGRGAVEATARRTRELF